MGNLNSSILQDHFSLLISNLQEGVLVENEERKILLTNQRFCDLFGIQATPDQMIGGDCQNAAEESKGFFKDPQQFVNRISDVLLDQKTVIGDKLETVTGVYLERDYVPIFIENVYKGHLWKYRDVTKSTLLLKSIETKNNELKEFAFMVSHDLKEPIRGITFLNEWALEALESNNLAEVKENLDHTAQRTLRIKKLIDGIIEYSKVGAMEEDLKTNVNLNEILNEIQKNNSEDNVTFHIHNNLPTIKGNTIMIEQIFQNLVSNSRKYTDGPCEISLKKINSNTVEFWDNGPGIPQKFHKEIFDTFRTIEIDKLAKQSTGIGLSIVKKAIEKNCGSIKVDENFTDGLKYILTFQAD